MVYSNTVVLQAPSRNWTKLLLDTYTEVYDVSKDVLDTSDSVFEENETQWKAVELERLHDSIREKLKNSLYPEKIQILTLIPMVTRVRIKTI